MATEDTRAQVLRTIDKADKIGVAGVVELLQRPVEDFGAGLDPVRAALIGRFLETKGDTNEQTLANMRAWFDHAPQVMRRLDLAVTLDEIAVGNRTALDVILALPARSDQTWSDGGRPANIGIALDDMIAAMNAKED